MSTNEISGTLESERVWLSLSAPDNVSLSSGSELIGDAAAAALDAADRREPDLVVVVCEFDRRLPCVRGRFQFVDVDGIVGLVTSCSLPTDPDVEEEDEEKMGEEEVDLGLAALVVVGVETADCVMVTAVVTRIDDCCCWACLCCFGEDAAACELRFDTAEGVC